MFALGVIAALAASVLFNVGVALQALDAREAPAEEALRLRLLVRLLRRRRWLAGLVLGGLGVPLQVAAFAWAPFVAVQPLLAAGLVVLLAIGSRVLEERVGGHEIGGVLAIALGVGLVSWGAPKHVEQHRSPGVVAAVAAVLFVLTLAPFALRRTRLARPMATTIAAAIGFATTNIATKLMADNFARGHWPNVAAWSAAALAAGITAIIAQMTAFKRLPATTVVPISFAIQTFLPIALEPLFLRESFSSVPDSGAPLIAGIVVLLAGVLAVARSRAVSLLAAAASR